MKKYLFIILLALVSLSGQAKKQKQLVILHTNDTHSAIFPINSQLPDTMKAGRGGFLRRIAMLKEERKKNPNLIYLDSGDFWQGSAYFTMFKGEVEIGLMNQMGVEASTIGNHEFDFGLENMAQMFRKANFPILCANYDFTGTAMEGITKPWIIIKRNGVKIGVFALAPAMKGLVFDDNCRGITYLDPAETAQKYIDILRKQEKCDLVICVSHLGWNIEGDCDEVFLSKTEGCDLVLGGHTHTYMPVLEYAPDKNGKMIPVDQNGKHGVFIGKLVLDLEKK